LTAPSTKAALSKNSLTKDSRICEAADEQMVRESNPHTSGDDETIEKHSWSIIYCLLYP
jgi:hypothetical protein